MVELDQFKTIMNAYEEPLAEMRDSLLRCRKRAENRRTGTQDRGTWVLG